MAEAMVGASAPESNPRPLHELLPEELRADFDSIATTFQFAAIRRGKPLGSYRCEKLAWGVVFGKCRDFDHCARVVGESCDCERCKF